MNPQHEILSAAPLLDERGCLREAGFARASLPVYDRASVTGNPFRRQEWDSYLITDSHLAISVSMENRGWFSRDSVCVTDLDQGLILARAPVHLFPLRRRALPESPEEGRSEVVKSAYAIGFYHENEVRELSFRMDRFQNKTPIRGLITLSGGEPERLVYAAPFRKENRFRFQQKLLGLRAEGWVEIGEKRIELTSDRFYAVLDWSRGMWPFANSGVCSTAYGDLDGVPFGWSVGCRQDDDAETTENAIFYDGRIHKFCSITAEKKKGIASAWVISSSDNRFSMEFTPELEHPVRCNLLAIRYSRSRMYGRFNGRITLDDGDVLPVKDFFGVLETYDHRF